MRLRTSTISSSEMNEDQMFPTNPMHSIDVKARPLIELKQAPSETAKSKLSFEDEQLSATKRASDMDVLQSVTGLYDSMASDMVENPHANNNFK